MHLQHNCTHYSRIFQTLSKRIYLSKLKKHWDELDNLSPLPTCVCSSCTCALTQKYIKVQQDQRLMVFLMKWPTTMPMLGQIS